MVIFSYRSLPCGWVSRQVISEVKTPEPTAGFMEGDANAVVPDLTITIVCPDRDETHFQVGVESAGLNEFQQKQVEPWNLSARSEDLMRYFFNLFSDAGMSNQGRLRRLIGVGCELFNLAPSHFKRALDQLVRQKPPPLKILIVSEEAHIPWELMVPPGNEPMLPLGALHAMGRWTAFDGRRTRQSVQLDRSWVVAPDYRGTADALPRQDEEAKFVLSLATGDRVNPATIDSLDQGAAVNLGSLLHFVGHGSIMQNSLSQALLLDEAQPLLTVDLWGMRNFKKALNQAQSLVFLNACKAGQPIRCLTGGAGGIATAFLNLGASAVIAPLWSVRDEIAHQVAKMIYEGMKNGQQPAELLRECRARAYQEGPEAGEDTFAAYSFYGDPSFTLKWRPSAR